ncbi:MAG: hypothetical protein Q4G09_00320 [Clostridia bacterium]|nr:hypothetical protein [Clostridia bacterium]
MEEVTVNMNKEDAIKYYANKIIEDSLEDCSEFDYCMYFDQYNDNGFIKNNRNEILKSINEDKRIAFVCLDKDSFNMVFWLHYCPCYYEEIDMQPLVDKASLKCFIDNTLKSYLNSSDKTSNTTTRELINDFMENEVNGDLHFSLLEDEIYHKIKEHICNTGFNEKYRQKYEIIVSKDNIQELINALKIELSQIKDDSIKEVGSEDVKKLLDKFDKNIDFEPEELTLMLCNENGRYLGIDNLDGQVFIEEFDDKEKCINWLNGIEEEFKEEEEEFCQ